MNHVSYELNKVIKYNLDLSQFSLLYNIEVGKCHKLDLVFWLQLTLLSG